MQEIHTLPKHSTPHSQLGLVHTCLHLFVDFYKYDTDVRSFGYFTGGDRICAVN